MRICCFFMFLMSSLFWQKGWAQGEEGEKHEKQDPPGKFKDPTEMSASLKKALEPPKKNEPQIPLDPEKSVVAEIKEAPIPVIYLKAKIIQKDRPGLAFIEFDQKLLLVTAGDTFTLPPKKENEKPLIIQIKEVSLTKVEIGIEGQSEGVILR